jgi:hypothetical protein
MIEAIKDPRDNTYRSLEECSRKRGALDAARIDIARRAWCNGVPSPDRRTLEVAAQPIATQWGLLYAVRCVAIGAYAWYVSAQAKERLLKRGAVEVEA